MTNTNNSAMAAPEEIPGVTKRCSKCREVKPVSSFWVDRSRPSGRYVNCAVCCKAYKRNRDEELRKLPWGLRSLRNRERTPRASALSKYTDKSLCRVCGRSLVGKRSFGRLCSIHANNLRRYGDENGMPLSWRDEIAPKYEGWVREGIARLIDHPATKAGLTLAQHILDWKPAPNSIRHRADTAVGRYIEMLRNNGVTAEEVIHRVAMLTAYLQDNPTAARGVRAERCAYSRAVLGALSWRGAGVASMDRVGALVHNELGALTMDYLYGWSLKLVNKLKGDAEAVGALKRDSMSY